MWGAPEHDIRVVLFWFISLCTILKYGYELMNHKRAIRYAKLSEHYKIQKNLLMKEHGLDNKTYKKLMRKDPNNPILQTVEPEIRVLGAEAPTVWDLLPIAFVRSVVVFFKWLVWERLLSKGPTDREKFKRQLERVHNREFTEEDVDNEIAKYEERMERSRNSNRYKKYIRYKKKHGLK